MGSRAQSGRALWTAHTAGVDLRHGEAMPPQTPVPPEFAGRPFLLAEARAAGLSRQVLRGRRFRRVFTRVYVSADLPASLALTADALLLLAPPGSVLSHHTAATLQRLPVPPTELVHVTVPDGTRGPRLPGVRPHQQAAAAATPGVRPQQHAGAAAGVGVRPHGDADAAASVGERPHQNPAPAASSSVRAARQELSQVAAQPVRLDGRLLSAPAQNFVELGEYLSLVDLVILGDAMVRRRLATCAQLVDAAGTSPRRRGVRLARRAAALVRPRVDSPMETRARLLIVLAGLPEPIANLVVRDDDGGWVGAVDLGYAAYRVAIEYHGDVHRSTPRQWRSDVAKAEHLGRLGWRVIILTADDVYNRPAQTLSRVREAIVAAGHPEVPGLDRAWREHFSPRDQQPRTVQSRAVR